MKYKLQISISNAQNLLDLIEYYNEMLKEFRGYINWKADYEEILEMGKDFFNFYIPDLRFVASEICYERWRDESRLSINRNSGELEYYIEMQSKIESQEDIADVENALRRAKQCISIYQRFIDDVMKLDIEGNAGVTDSAKIKDDAEELDVWAIGNNYDTDLDVVTEEQLGMDRSYHTLLKNVRDAERFNYHSDYWGSAEGYQDTAISIMEELEPYVGQYVTIPYDDMEEGEENKPVKVLGLLIDKQYNSHLKVLIEE